MKVGERVYHRSMQQHGTVEAVDRKGVVTVKYDRKSDRTREHWRGVYDSNWFRVYPDMLVVTDNSRVM